MVSGLAHRGCRSVDQGPVRVYSMDPLIVQKGLPENICDGKIPRQVGEPGQARFFFGTERRNKWQVSNAYEIRRKRLRPPRLCSTVGGTETIGRETANLTARKWPGPIHANRHLARQTVNPSRTLARQERSSGNRFEMRNATKPIA